MEFAVLELEKFSGAVCLIDANCRSHSEIATILRADAPIFDLGTSSLCSPQATKTRIRSVFEEADALQEFATIYQLRRLNFDLSSRLSQVVAAIEGLDQRVVSSIHSLSRSIEGGFEDLQTLMSRSARQLREQHEELLRSADQDREQAAEYHRENNEEMARIHDDRRTVEMEQARKTAEQLDQLNSKLDDIRHRRCQRKRDSGDNTY